ncbi:MAG: oligosaccharide flippase family protein, partial [Actinobacteria bacterium]|nr:oligosaccharide flippase family protein [Actinomycetota bacterium]
MSLARRVSYNTTAQVVGRLLAAAASVGVLRMSTRYLGVDRYGDYVTASALVLLLTTLADWGLVTISAREIARDGTRAPEIVGVNLAMRSLLSLCLIPLAVLIGYLAYRTNHDVRFAVAVLSPMLVLLTIQSTAGAVFIARERA